jgi:hypothetical protein
MRVAFGALVAVMACLVVLARYTDGRVVLTKVTWSFGLGFTGQIAL